MKVYFSPGLRKVAALTNIQDQCPDCAADLTKKDALEAIYYVLAIVEGNLDKEGKFTPTNYLENGLPAADEGLGFSPFSYRCAGCGYDLLEGK